MKIFSEEFMLDTENKFKNFIMKSITGMKKDYYRKEYIRNNRELLFYNYEKYSEYLQAYRDDVFEDEISAFEDDFLISVLYSLTEKQLQIIKLLAIEDLTERETAKMLNISQQRVNTAKANAKKKFIKMKQRDMR